MTSSEMAPCRRLSIIGLVEKGERALDAAGGPQGDLTGNGGLALKEDRRAGAFDQRPGGGAAIEGGAGLLEKIEVTERGTGDDEAGGAGGNETAVAAIEPGRIAERHGIDGLVDGEGGGVADDGADIGDGDEVVAGGVETDLADLGAADQTIGADQALEGDAGIGGDGETGGGGLLVDDAVEVAVGIGVAGDRGGALVLLAQAAERRGLAQLAGGDDHPGVDRRGGEQCLDGGFDGAVAAEAQRDHALAAEERHGVGLVHQKAGIGGDGVHVEADMGEGIVTGDRLHQGRGPLGDETLVVAVDQDDALARIRLRNEAVGAGGFDLDHEFASVQA